MSAAAATSVMLATQNGSSISPTFALVTSIIVSAFVIYLSLATIYYGGLYEAIKSKFKKKIYKKLKNT